MDDNSGSKEKTGLVMEGGAMRALFTAGVTDVMMENGISFDGAIGVSAGAAFGCNFKSKQPGRAIRYNLKYCRDRRYCSLSSLFATGDLYNARFCYQTLPRELDRFDFRTYKSNPMEFFAVATDIESGLPEYKKIEECDDNGLNWLRASASMPLVSRPVSLDGKMLLDGGISDSIPLKWFEGAGFSRNIVILTQPRSYQKKKTLVIPFLKLFLRKYPLLLKAMENRHEMYNAETSYVFEREKIGAAMVICPEKPLGISRTEKDSGELRRVYEIGRNLGKEKLGDIKEFLRG